MCSSCDLVHLLSGSQTALHPASFCTLLLKVSFSCFHLSSSENMAFDGLAFRIRYFVFALASSSPWHPVRSDILHSPCSAPIPIQTAWRLLCTQTRVHVPSPPITICLSPYSQHSIGSPCS